MLPLVAKAWPSSILQNMISIGVVASHLHFHVGLIGDVAGTYFFGDNCLFREVGLEANRFRCGFMLNIQVGGLEIRDEVVPRLVIGRTLSPVLACVFNLARLKS